MNTAVTLEAGRVEEWSILSSSIAGLASSSMYNAYNYNIDKHEQKSNNISLKNFSQTKQNDDIS